MTPGKPLPRLLPKPPEPGQSNQAQPGPDENTSGPRPRRQLVKQACQNCRKRKYKCDGVRPRCAACLKSVLTCEYAIPEHSGESRDANHRSVVELLREGSEAESAQVLQRIREANDFEGAVEEILLAGARLLLGAVPGRSGVATARDDAEPMPSVVEPSSSRKRLRSPHDDSDFMFEKDFMTDVRDQYIEKNVFVDLPAQNVPLSRWTEVSDDDRLMNHLMRLFWTWDSVVEKTLYRPIFEEDVGAMDPLLADDHRGGFCSRFLVNALLALSCLYTMDFATFKDPGDASSRGRRWADEADALLAEIEEDRPSFPLLQGLLALFCYEGNLGLGTRSVSYYLRATNVYKALNEPDSPRHRPGVDEGRIERERLAKSWCMWGFYCTEWRPAQGLGFRKMTRKPAFSKVWHEPDFPFSLSNSAGHWWFRYPMSVAVERSMKVEVREADVKLTEIIEDALNFIYPEEGGIPPAGDPRRGLELYRAIAHWKQSCKGRIRLEVASLPSAILLHIGAEVMLTAVLRPFANMSKTQFGAFDPRERCYAHASSLASAIWAFRSFSVIRFEYWVIHALGTAAYIVVGATEDSPIQVDTLMRSCQCLYEMRVNLPLATDVLCGIQVALRRAEQPMPPSVNGYFQLLKHRRDGLMHHSVAALLPNATNISRISRGEDVLLQDLLYGLDELGVD